MSTFSQHPSDDLAILRESSGKTPNFFEISLNFPKIVANLAKFPIFPAKVSKKLPKPRYFPDFVAETSDFLEKVAKIQLSVRVFLRKRRFKRILKLFRYRRRIFEEILSTERSYVAFLSLIVEKVLIPVQDPANFPRFFAKNEAKRTEFLRVFGNLPSLLSLHEKMSQKLAQNLEKYSYFSTFGPVFKEFLPFFKLYFPYCEEFEANMGKLQDFRLKNAQLRDFLAFLDGSEALQGLDLASLLIMPVQKVCKYVLFFKELLKNTPKTHPDFASFAENARKVEEINAENNQKMNKTTRNRKLQQLQREFGAEVAVLRPNRDFFFEEALEIVRKSAVLPVIAYFLTDLVLVVERKTVVFAGKLLVCVELDAFSKVKSLDDSKYFANLFTLQGKAGCVATFVAENAELKAKLMAILNEMIANLKENARQRLKTLRKLDETKENRGNRRENREFSRNPWEKSSVPLEVSVIGTQERVFEGFREKTVYIIEFCRENALFRHCAYLNYREIYELYEIALKILGGNALPEMQKLNFFEKKTKTIETRKIMIENFLWALLSYGEIQRNSHGILEKLGLSTEFFGENAESWEKSQGNLGNTAESRENQGKCAENCENAGNLREIPEISQSPMKSRQFSKKCSKCSSMSRILQESCWEKPNFFANSRESSRKIQTKAQFHVAEILLMDGTSVKLAISSETTAKDACFSLAKALNLEFFADFRLISSENAEFLAEDELLLRFCLPKAYLQEKSQRNCEFFQRFSLKMRASLQFLRKKPAVFFKKAVFLAPEQEEIDWQRDQVRRNLIVSQLLREISSGNWPLKTNDYALFAAFFALDAENFTKSRENRQNPHKSPANYENCQEIAVKVEEIQQKPSKLAEFLPKDVLLSRNAEFWTAQISRKVEKLKEKFKQKPGNGDFQAFIQGNLLKFAGKQPFFGSTFYECDVYKDESLKLVEIMALNRENIKLLSREREVLREIALENVREVKVFPKSLVFSLKSQGSLRVNCGKSFEISQFINTYQRIRENCEEF